MKKSNQKLAVGGMVAGAFSMAAGAVASVPIVSTFGIAVLGATAAFGGYKLLTEAKNSLEP